jgi:hypothetical protein
MFRSEMARVYRKKEIHRVARSGRELGLGPRETETVHDTFGDGAHWCVLIFLFRAFVYLPC